MLAIKYFCPLLLKRGGDYLLPKTLFPQLPDLRTLEINVEKVVFRHSPGTSAVRPTERCLLCQQIMDVKCHGLCWS